MRAYATLTSKGQVTLPKSIRDRHDLKPGDTVEFREEGGRLWVEAKPVRAVDLIGILGKSPAGVSLSDEELVQAIDDAVAEAVAEDDERIMREWRKGAE